MRSLLSRIMMIGLLALSLTAMSASVSAQNTNGGGGATAGQTRDDGMDYGWIGLLGLAGLAGLLRRRDTHNHDRNR